VGVMRGVRVGLCVVRTAVQCTVYKKIIQKNQFVFKTIPFPSRVRNTGTSNTTT
jgi:hypothetical protein